VAVGDTVAETPPLPVGGAALAVAAPLALAPRDCVGGELAHALGDAEPLAVPVCVALPAGLSVPVALPLALTLRLREPLADPLADDVADAAPVAVPRGETVRGALSDARGVPVGDADARVLPLGEREARALAESLTVALGLLLELPLLQSVARGDVEPPALREPERDARAEALALPVAD